MVRSIGYPFIGLLVAFTLIEFVHTIGHELIIIEKNPYGLYVATSEHSYAFTHPDLAECNWSSVSLRDDQVFIVKQDNSTCFKLWDDLDESERDLISDLRSDYIANLAGLRLTHLARPKKHYSKSKGKKQMKNNNNNNRYESWRSPTYSASSNAASFRYKPSLSSAYATRRQPQAAQQQQHQKYQVFHRGPVASSSPSSYSSKAGISSGIGINNGRGSVGRFEAIEKVKKYAATSNYYNKVTAAMDDDESDERQPSTYGNHGISSDGSYGSGGSSSSGSFNYYNVQQSELKKKLTGDVYHFDMNGNILDVFSSTISIRLEQKPKRRKTSILYRDESFFSYAGTTLPSAISRLSIKNEFAFFVHKDSTVLAKPIHFLNLKEKKLVHKTKAHVNKLCQWQTLPSGFIFAIPTLSPVDSFAGDNSTVSSHTNATYRSDEHAIDATTPAPTSTPTTTSIPATTTQKPYQLQTTTAALTL